MITRPVTPVPSGVDAEINVPGSKSIANRALLCAALSEGESRLDNVPDGDDTVAMVAALGALEIDAGHEGERVVVVGTGGRLPPGPRSLHAGLAGTTSRFVTALAALGTADIVIDGDPPLRERPFGPLHDALALLGVAVTPAGAAGGLPTTVHGPPTAGRTRLRGDVSSQFVSALMMIGPYLPGGLELALTTPLVSRPYVELTAQVMGWFGVSSVDIGDEGVVVPPATYRGTDVSIEPDASSASYPLATAAVAAGRVTVPGLGTSSRQGDASFASLLSRMGCDVDQRAESTTVRRPAHRPLVGIDVDMADVSDLVPTLAVVACYATTPTRITGVGFIRGKESDRIGDLADELRAAGADVQPTDDGLLIAPSSDSLHPARLATHHDHRLAMAFAVLGAATPGIEVESPDVVSKSWPTFWEAHEVLAGSAP